MLKSVCSDHACDHSFRVLDRWALARRFFGGNKLVKLVKSGFFELYFLFCLSWTHKCKSAYSFLNLGSYLNMYHGYASLKKEHFLPVFTEKRALFQHILRDAKSTKCELKEHLWEKATVISPLLIQSPLHITMHHCL